MGIRKYNPTTPGRRGATVSDFAELTPGAATVKALRRHLVSDLGVAPSTVAFMGYWRRGRSEAQ